MSQFTPSLAPPDVRSATDELRRTLPYALAAVLTLWIAYSISGLRPPWSPIVVNDLNSGGAKRQAIFTLSAATAFWSLFRTRSIGAVLVQHAGPLLIGGWLLGTVLISSDPVLTMKRSIIFNFGLLTILVAVHATRNPFQFMQRVLVNCVTVAAWVSLIGWFVLPAAAVSIAERPGLAGVAGHPNTLAPAMVVGLVLSLGQPAARRTALTRVNQIIMLVALYLTDSITAWALLVTCSVVYLALSSDGYRRGVLLLTATTIAGLVLIIGPDTIKAFLFQTVNRNPTLSGRDQLWAIVFAEGMQRPFFGTGFGAFWYEGRGRELVITWNPREAHHAYVDLFVDIGAFGVLIVIAVLIGGLWRGWRQWAGQIGTDQRRAVASAVALCVSLMGMYAFGESFYLKLDKVPMFALLWIVCLLGNRDANGIAHEFRGT